METRLPQKLRLLRVRQGLTLVEAAEKTGVSRGTLSSLERGHSHPVAPTLVKIARGYGVPVEDLLEEQEPVPKAPAHGSWRERLRALSDNVKTSTALAAKSVQTGLWLGGTTTEDLQNLKTLEAEWGVSSEEILDALVAEGPGLDDVLDRKARRALKDKEPQRDPVLRVIAGGKTA